MVPGFTIFDYDHARDGALPVGTKSTGWLDATGIDSVLIRGTFSGGTTQIFVDQGRLGTGAAILTSADQKPAAITDTGALVPVAFQWVQIRIVQTTAPATTAQVAVKAPLVAMTLLTGGGGGTPSSTVVSETSYGQSSSAGAASEYSRGDHTHGSPSLASSAPSTSAVGDAAANGAGTAPAKSDHVHGREAFGAIITETSFGQSSSNGVSTTLPRSDHSHGTPPSPQHPAVFSKSGVLAVGAGTGRLPFRRACTIVSVKAIVNTPPTGASLIVDVNKNGTTIFTTQANRPTIAAGANNSSTTAPDVTSLAVDDYLTVDIDQVGSTVAGSDLTVVIEYTVN